MNTVDAFYWTLLCLGTGITKMNKIFKQIAKFFKLHRYEQVFIQYWRGSHTEWELIIQVNVCIG